MSREEKVVENKLCWRSVPTGVWRPYTQEQLTLRLTTLGMAYRELEKDYNILMKLTK